MTTRTILLAASALLLAACGGAPAPTGGRVSIQADLASMAAQGPVVVTVEASPARATTQLDYDAVTGRFSGTMSLPAGLQQLTVLAWSDTDADGQMEMVAAGNAEATVVENQTSAVVVLMLDLTPPPPVPDHSPIITSAGMSNQNPLPNEPVSVWVSAVDVDGDPMTYLWEVTCNAGTVTIGDPTAPATTISVDQAATCTVFASVMANGKQVYTRITMQVGGTGEASIELAFSPAPVVTQVTASELATGWACSVDRAGSEATCPDALGIGAIVNVYVTLGAGSTGAEALLDACGTALAPVDFADGTAHFVWNVQGPLGVCLLTASATSYGRTDSLPVALQLL